VATEPIQARADAEEAAATWIARRDSGAWTDTDAAAFEAWLAQSAGHRVAWYRLHSAWTEAGRVRALGAASAGTASAPFEQVTSTEWGGSPPATARRPSRRRTVFAVAASVLILLLGGAVVAFKDELLPTHHFTTVVGGLQAIPMSDGSRVTLNTDSEVRISLDDRERVVEIEYGEAFFQVAHDAGRPFIVKAGERRVIAVGTQFSVRRQGTDLRVVVEEGTVRYQDHSGDPPTSGGTLLPAGSFARTEGATLRVEQRPVVEAERNLTWRSGLLTFRDTPLAEAVAEFNRYNTRKIVIGDPSIAALEVGGVFRSNNVDPFVHLLERGFAIQASVQPDRIVLRAR
jgi:transmembrane sensor